MAAIVMAIEAARNRDWAETLYTEYLGDPLPIAGSTIIMEVRQYGGQAGPALCGDPNVQVLADEQIGTDIDPVDGIEKPLRQLVLLPKIARAALGALPGQNQPEAGDPQRFEYEVMIQYADGLRDPLWRGDFNVDPGVVA